MYLGLDLGTTKTAATICDAGGRVLAAASGEHGARRPGPPGWAEQDPEALLASQWARVRALPADLRRQVCAVGAAGQMHGLVIVDAAGVPLTPMITWQDQRALGIPGLLRELSDLTGRPQRTGYACATLAWLVRRGRLPAGAAGSGSIQDLAVARLCGEPRPVNDPTNAASWGLYDFARSAWDGAAVRAAGLPESLLPELRPCGSLAGLLCPPMAESLGLPAGIPVAVATGDNQASLVATLTDPETQLNLTLGTGGQASAVMAPGEALEAVAGTTTCECRPFFGGRLAVVAASLCGGAAWAWLADSLIAMMRDLGAEPPPRDRVFARMNELGLASQDEITVLPHFLGERHDERLRGVLAGLKLDNFRLGAVARGLARGIVCTLRDMLPPAVLVTRRSIVGSGNALCRTPLLQAMVREEFGLPLTLSEGREEAAAGAARIAAAAAGET